MTSITPQVGPLGKLNEKIWIMPCCVACYVTTGGGVILQVMEKYIRKVTRVGQRSLSVVIPADIIKELGIHERQKLVVRRSGQKIIIEDWKE